MKFSNHGFSQDFLKDVYKIMNGQPVEEKKKLDPVGKEDADIDNDGDTDKSDQYLHNRRKAIKKAMKEESCDCDCGKSPCEECGEDHHEMKEAVEEAQLSEISAKLARKAAAASSAKSFEYGSSAYGDGAEKEADRLEKKSDKAYAHVMKRQGQKGVDKTNRLAGHLIYGRSRMESVEEAKNAPSKENGGIAHQCATHVQHATYGEGRCIPGMHTIVETEEGEGFVTHYDVMFQGENGPVIVEDVSVNELKIIASESHKHSKRK